VGGTIYAASPPKTGFSPVNPRLHDGREDTDHGCRGHNCEAVTINCLARDTSRRCRLPWCHALVELGFAPGRHPGVQVDRREARRAGDDDD
jgi:hypothetical protein